MEYLEIISTATSSLIRLKNILGVRRLAQRVYGQKRTVVEESRLRRHTSVRTSRSQWTLQSLSLSLSLARLLARSLFLSLCACFYLFTTAFISTHRVNWPKPMAFLGEPILILFENFLKLVLLITTSSYLYIYIKRYMYSDWLLICCKYLQWEMRYWSLVGCWRRALFHVDDVVT